DGGDDRALVEGELGAAQLQIGGAGGELGGAQLNRRRGVGLGQRLGTGQRIGGILGRQLSLVVGNLLRICVELTDGLAGLDHVAGLYVEADQRADRLCRDIDRLRRDAFADGGELVVDGGHGDRAGDDGLHLRRATTAAGCRGGAGGVSGATLARRRGIGGRQRQVQPHVPERHVRARHKVNVAGRRDDQHDERNQYLLQQTENPVLTRRHVKR